MKCYTYIVARDFGFAPNPFGGFCTLATCKPDIRSIAQIGDWIIGIGSSTKRQKNKMIYAMKVSEILTYNEYWNDLRFEYKKPLMNGSLVTAFGDNIYHTSTETNEWLQANSHHSNEDGTINELNLKRDTKSQNVLISNHFFYFGVECPAIPAKFINETTSRKYRTISDETIINDLIGWLDKNYPVNELIGDPTQFSDFKRYDGK